MAQKIVPNLWFDTEAEQAAVFYTSVFKDSRIVKTSHYTDAGPREGTPPQSCSRAIRLRSLRGRRRDTKHLLQADRKLAPCC